MEKENITKKYEIINNSEYADIILDYVELNGNKFRKPKEWHPELLYNSKLHQDAKISTKIPKVKMIMSPASELLITAEYPLSKENLSKYEDSTKSKNKFKLFVPKDKRIRILFDKNLKESIDANNKRVGFQQYDKDLEVFANLLSIDIKEGSLIIELIIKE